MQQIEALYAGHLAALRQRYDRLLERAGFDPLVVYSGAPAEHFLDDNEHPFVVNPHFKAWVPLTDYPMSFLIYAAGTRPKLVLYRAADYWHGTPAEPRGVWTDHVDLVLIDDPDAARAHLPPANAVTAFIGEVESRFAEWPIGDPNPGALLDALHYHRAWKSEYELACMREANAIAVRGHRAAAQAFAAGASELEIHLAYCRACGVPETELPYVNIVALNAHGAILHYRGRDAERPATPRSFVIDAGASYAGYASDITRTYAAHEGEFASLIDAMESAQQALCASVVPGVDFGELHLEAHRRIAQILANAGLVKMPPESIVETGLSSVFFPHGLGHYIGLQVHDVGAFFADAEGTVIPRPEGHPFLRLTRTLEPGQVTTIEPGLYFIPQLLAEARDGAHAGQIDWSRIEHLLPYGGVRIEDDVAVTAQGHENLTRDAFACAEAAG